MGTEAGRRAAAAAAACPPTLAPSRTRAQGLAGAAKSWLHVDARGKACLVTPGKHAIVRDLRIRWAGCMGRRQLGGSGADRSAAAAAAAACLRGEPCAGPCRQPAQRPKRLLSVLSRSYRDLLQLDPAVPTPFPAAILIRPRAGLAVVE